MFKVIDLQTGTWANPEAIAVDEDWADGLIYCDMEGFAMLEDGSLLLVDECGSFRYCPPGRFQVVQAPQHPLHSDAASAAIKPGDLASATDTDKPAGTWAAPVS